MSKNFNINEASDDELRERLEALRGDRKTYSTPKRTTRKRTKEEPEDIGIFSDISPEVAAEILKLLGQQEDANG